MSNIVLKTRQDLHLARKIWHFCGVFTIIVGFHNLDRSSALQGLSIATFIVFVHDVLRLQIPTLNKAIISIFSPIMRDRERNGISGISYLLFGVFIMVLYFPRPIVHLSLFFLALADPIASYVGILHGKDKLFQNKTLQGSMAAFAVCTVISAIFYFSQNLMTDRLLIVSVLSGLIGAVAELFPLWKFDDNFSLPLISSCLLWALFYLFGGF